MEEDISRSFLMNNFDVSTDLRDSGALNGETWVSNNGFGNLAPDFFGLGSGNSSSFDIPENFMDVFDELDFNTTTLSLSNPGRINNERVVAPDNSEVDIIPSTNHPFIASTINFRNSILEVFDSHFDISVPALSISRPQNSHSEPSVVFESTNVTPSSYLNSRIESNHTQPRQPRVSADLHGAPPMQTIHKPKFKRRNQVVLEGNNKVGRKGILRCEACRNTHSKCKFTTSTTCCEYCKSRGISCVPKWGPKREECLKLAKQLPTPDDAVINEIDGQRLHFIRYALPDLALIQKIIAFYGPSVRSSSLRYAVLSAIECNLLNQRRVEEDLVYAFDAIMRKNVSSLGEDDMIAIGFTFRSMRRLNRLSQPGILSRLGIQKSAVVRFPSFSVQLQRFVRSMRTLLEQSRGNFRSYPFADYWRYISNYIVKVLPLDFTDDIVWEFLALCRQCFGPTGLNELVEDVKKVNTFRPLGRNSPDAHYLESGLNMLVRENAIIALLAFWTVLQKEMTKDFVRDHRLLTAVDDIRASTNSLEASSIFRNMIHAPLFQFTELSSAFGFGKVSCYEQTVTVSLTKLFLTLLLDGPTIRHARISQTAIEAAAAVIFVANFSVRGSPLSSLVPNDPFKDYNVKRFSALLVAAVCGAALVHPISHFLEVRNAAMEVLNQWAPAEISEMVDRYWTHPEDQYEEMLRMAFDLTKSIYRDIGETEDVD